MEALPEEAKQQQQQCDHPDHRHARRAGDDRSRRAATIVDRKREAFAGAREPERPELVVRDDAGPDLQGCVRDRVLPAGPRQARHSAPGERPVRRDLAHLPTFGGGRREAPGGGRRKLDVGRGSTEDHAARVLPRRGGRVPHRQARARGDRRARCTCSACWSTTPTPPTTCSSRASRWSTSPTGSPGLEHIKDGTVIFTAHGVSPQVKQRAVELGLKPVDATCSDVVRTHELVADLARKGYEVVYIGRKGPPRAGGRGGRGAGQGAPRAGPGGHRRARADKAIGSRSRARRRCRCGTPRTSSAASRRATRRPRCTTRSAARRRSARRRRWRRRQAGRPGDRRRQPAVIELSAAGRGRQEARPQAGLPGRPARGPGPRLVQGRQEGRSHERRLDSQRS